MKPHILIVDDELGPRESLRAVFKGTYRVTTAASAAEGLEVLAREPVELVLTDVIMPDMDGLTFLRHVRERHPGLPVVMISASSSVRPVVEAMRQGAQDYVAKPFDVEEVQHIVRRAMETSAMQRRVRSLESEIDREFPVHGIVGGADGFRDALDRIRKAAASDATVLILGESGTGKELAARLLHRLSPRQAEPFVAVHCGALPESLMESELFGHEKGAFTNADRMKHGRFDLAGSGTLFFDEVSEMSLTTQMKLLRVLQEREFMRVGGTQVIKTNARIVAASARDLRKLAAEGKFRDDLYYRLGVVPVTLPPLRERPGDIERLATHFLEQLGRNLDAVTEGFDPDAMERLAAYRWPGNVRELRNVVERMLVLHGSQRLITPDCLPEEFHEGGGPLPAPDAGLSLEDRVGAVERRMIEEALRRCGGVQTRAAEYLGTTRRILRYRMEKLNIPFRPADAPPPPQAGGEGEGARR